MLAESLFMSRNPPPIKIKLIRTPIILPIKRILRPNLSIRYRGIKVATQLTAKFEEFGIYLLFITHPLKE
jgi:hypothetical protein